MLPRFHHHRNPGPPTPPSSPRPAARPATRLGPPLSVPPPHTHTGRRSVAQHNTTQHKQDPPGPPPYPSDKHGHPCMLCAGGGGGGGHNAHAADLPSAPNQPPPTCMNCVSSSSCCRARESKRACWPQGGGARARRGGERQGRAYVGRGRGGEMRGGEELEHGVQASQQPAQQEGCGNTGNDVGA